MYFFFLPHLHFQGKTTQTFLPRLFSQDSVTVLANENGSLTCTMTLVFWTFSIMEYTVLYRYFLLCAGCVEWTPFPVAVLQHKNHAESTSVSSGPQL